jgi:hypothetical protein
MHISYFLPRVLRLSVEKIMWEKSVVSRLYYSAGIRHLLQLGAHRLGLIDATYTEFSGQVYVCPTCGTERGAPVCAQCMRKKNR